MFSFFYIDFAKARGGVITLYYFCLQNLSHIGFHFPFPGKIKRLISNQLFQECSWSRHSVCQMGWTPETYKGGIWFSNMLLICLQLPFVLADLKKSPIEEDFYLSCSWVLETGDSSEFGEVNGKVVHVWHRDGNSIHLREVILSCTLSLHQLIICIIGGISDRGFLALDMISYRKKNNCFLWQSTNW